MRGIEIKRNESFCICAVGTSGEVVLEGIKAQNPTAVVIECVPPYIINRGLIDRVAESMEIYRSIMSENKSHNAFFNRYDIRNPSFPFSPKNLFSKKWKKCRR